MEAAQVSAICTPPNEVFTLLLYSDVSSFACRFFTKNFLIYCKYWMSQPNKNKALRRFVWSLNTKFQFKNDTHVFRMEL